MLCWVDVESTGLDESQGHLLEVAMVVTDDNLKETTYASVIIKPQAELELLKSQIDPVVKEMHTKNGLFDDIEKFGWSMEEATARMIAFVKEAFASVPDVPSSTCECGKRKSWHVSQGGEGECVFGAVDGGFCAKLVPAVSMTPLAGSTVGFDRRWLRHHMPALEAMFLHRSVDVSSFGEMASRWAPEVYENRPKSTDTHRALADARGSIELLKYYREKGFVRGSREA